MYAGTKDPQRWVLPEVLLEQADALLNALGNSVPAYCGAPRTITATAEWKF